MSLALVVMEEGDERRLASFIRDNALADKSMVLWRLENSVSIRAMLWALEEAWQASPVKAILFPPSIAGDELATRLAWRLNGTAVCQILSCDLAVTTVTKAVYGNALTATFHTDTFPVCYSLSPHLSRAEAALPSDICEKHLVSVPQAGELSSPEVLHKSQHPLQSAQWVLATGVGANADVFMPLAAELHAEPGYTRQRVMAGGCDEQRMIGISGQSVSPGVCIIAGASGASAFMAGVQQSRFIVAVNTDPSAAVFAAADVGIVGDAEAVLTALAACLNRT
ncbi:electron transfer flavoprotein subunit alpha/FixB family protein [Enterobacter roggenkampii]|uniref:electron transfer flavoprotein subunit alpha/FixB family protein n=1 Tax=Enterobacter roggenkampii TaxID=1812935 RepID=UPI002FFB5F32